jgi:hypothetical protein
MNKIKRKRILQRVSGGVVIWLSAHFFITCLSFDVSSKYNSIQFWPHFVEISTIFHIVIVTIGILVLGVWLIARSN